MWIKRQHYIDLQCENASRAATIHLNLETIRTLRAEIDYWREKFESAQNRADRVADLAFESSGMRPISDLGVAERDKQAELARKAAKENEALMTEMFADEIGGDEGELPTDGFGIEPELVAALTQAAEEMKAKK